MLVALLLVTTACRSNAQESLCHRALGRDSASSRAVTLQAAREMSPGGPAGILPARGAFPDLPGDTKAAYCWFSTPPSPGTTMHTWAGYLVVPDGRSLHLLTVTQPQAPDGPPNIK
jgi:hypothetical protein